jgi:hypothetical protein
MLQTDYGTVINSKRKHGMNTAAVEWRKGDGDNK